MTKSVILSNEASFSIYRDRLFLALCSNTGRSAILSILTKFERYCCGKRPTEELARSFLGEHSSKKPSTKRRYRAVIKNFMSWYLTEEDENIVKMSSSLSCQLVENPIELMLRAIQAKKTHKKTIERDSLLIEIAWETGITRGELAALKVGDVKSDCLLIKNPSSSILRGVPLSEQMARRLQIFIKNKSENSTLFNLKAPCVTGKINRIAKKTSLGSFRLGFCRHEFAAKLLEGGTTPNTVRRLLGHQKLASTKNYFAVAIPPRYSQDGGQAA